MMKFDRRLLVPLLGMLLVVSAAVADTRTRDYTVGPRDTLLIKVWGENLEVTEEVSNRGSIQFFFLGEVQVAGLTTDQVREKITRELIARQYFKDPVVIVQLVEHKSKEVQIYGSVLNPGVYYLDTNYISLLKLISLAGGATANRGNVALIWRGGSVQTMDRKRPEPLPGSAESLLPEELRQEESIEVNLLRLLDMGDLSEDVIIYPGDYVLIRSIETESVTSNYVWIEGAVAKPQQILYRPGMTALQAVIQAGGFLDVASPNRSTITRTGADNQITSFRVRLKDVQRGRTVDIQLEPGDRLFVPEGWW